MPAHPKELVVFYARDKYSRYDGCADCRCVHLSTGPDDIRCAICREKAGMPPLSMGPHIPWYEKMTPEEYEKIRTAPWTATETRTNDNGDSRVHVFKRRERGEEGTAIADSAPDNRDYSQPHTFEMTYRTESGGSTTLMVGKTIPHPSHGMVFFHAAGDGKSEGQAHDTTDCPCPVDTILADKLEVIGIKYFYAYDRDRETLYRAEVGAILAAPTAVYSAKTIRQRHFLPSADWTALHEVTEHVLPDRRTRELRRSGRVILTVPFINRSVTLGIAELF